MYYNNRFLKRDTIEYREYQVNLARQAAGENCIVVLPTGLGKTTVALQVICEYLEEGRGGVLFLAPTRVLANQHYQFLRDSMTIDDIVLITGEDPLQKRKKLWGNSIICATPEIAKNDLDRGMADPQQFVLVIFDEAHRTVGDYAYSGIAQRLLHHNVRIMGMTATLPSEKEKATEIITTLRIAGIAQRSEADSDVSPYVQQTSVEWVRVILPDELKAVQKLLKLALDERYETLRSNGLTIRQRSLSALLKLRQIVLAQDRRSAKPLFTAIRIHYALNILEAHGITTFLEYCKRARDKKGAGVRDLFEHDPNFTRAIQLACHAQEHGIEHSKMPKLLDLLQNLQGRALVFSSYRDSVYTIQKNLESAGLSSAVLIGKAGETGLKQKKQVETVQRFRDGMYDILVCTRVGEEGLDISEVNLVIFYDNVPSSIRFVQRKGRTGRKDAGRLVVLMAKDTIDETYYWIGHRKITSASKMGSKMASVLEGQKTGLDRFV